MADTLAFATLLFASAALVSGVLLLRRQGAALARLSRLEQLEAERAYREGGKAGGTFEVSADAVVWRDGDGTVRLRMGVW